MVPSILGHYEGPVVVLSTAAISLHVEKMHLLVWFLFCIPWFCFLHAHSCCFDYFYPTFGCMGRRHRWVIDAVYPSVDLQLRLGCANMTPWNGPISFQNNKAIMCLLNCFNRFEDRLWLLLPA